MFSRTPQLTSCWGKKSTGTAVGALLARWRTLGLQWERSWPAGGRWDCSGSAPGALEDAEAAVGTHLARWRTLGLQRERSWRAESTAGRSARCHNRPPGLTIHRLATLGAQLGTQLGAQLGDQRGATTDLLGLRSIRSPRWEHSWGHSWEISEGHDRPPGLAIHRLVTLGREITAR